MNTPVSVQQMNISLLAYLGDCVFELFVRERLVYKHETTAKCNKEALSFVTATHQAEAVKRLIGVFTEEETAVFKRGKNHKSSSNPRNCDVYTYRLATGLEAVFGYNYLLGNTERNAELFNIGYGDII